MAERDPMRWVWRGVTGVTLLLGWVFILWQNKFHFDVPVIVVAIAFFAVVMSVSTLWRVGAAAVAPEDTSEEAWARPLGERAELEKEKKSLLKAIKDAEFDRAMGKLSKLDADDLIRMYRARAIAVIKELERMEAGAAESPREQIERELAARLAIERGKTAASKKGKAKEEARAKKLAAAAAAAAASEDNADGADAAAATEPATEPASEPSGELAPAEQPAQNDAAIDPSESPVVADAEPAKEARS